MQSKTELIASCWTTAGDIYYGGPTEVSPHDFRGRVETAARVGFCGFGLFHPDMMAAVERLGFPTMKRILADNGMKYIDLEIIGDWFTDGARRIQAEQRRRDLLNAAERLGAGNIKAFGDGAGGDWPTDKLIETFAALCAEAADAGTRVALEYMPFTNIKTPARALEIVQGAGAENGGLTVDIWHTSRGGIHFDEIAKLPAERIFIVEIDDARAEPVGSLSDDTNNERMLCGEVDIPGFLQAIKSSGYRGPIGVEILSLEQRRRPLWDATSLAFQTAMQQFHSRPTPPQA